MEKLDLGFTPVEAFAEASLRQIDLKNRSKTTRKISLEFLDSINNTLRDFHNVGVKMFALIEQSKDIHKSKISIVGKNGEQLFLITFHWDDDFESVLPEIGRRDCHGFHYVIYAGARVEPTIERMYDSIGLKLKALLRAEIEQQLDDFAKSAKELKGS